MNYRKRRLEMKKPYLTILIIAVLGFVVLPSTAHALETNALATYYVSPAGNDINDGLAPETAFSTIQRAADTTAAGDRVEVQPGIYNESVLITTSGTQDNLITYYADGEVVIYAREAYGIKLCDVDYIKVEGFIVCNVSSAGIVVEGENNTHNLTTNNACYEDIFIPWELPFEETVLAEAPEDDDLAAYISEIDSSLITNTTDNAYNTYESEISGDDLITNLSSNDYLPQNYTSQTPAQLYNETIGRDLESDGSGAGPSLEWAARYNGPGNYDDYAKAIALDAQGNVYVTGNSGSDYATIKYDTNGNRLWVARYSGCANAIALDAQGNVYVTGNSGSDYATVKYDTNGNQLWAARYNGPGNDSDSATSIALDSSGNVYVTGGSSGSGTDSDYATIKYDTNGNQLWVARYNGSGNYYVDKATSIALDAQGNVYVTGYSGWSYGPSHDYDYATIKYDTNGSQLWLARYDSSARSDGVAAIALDVQGNVYVTGDSGYNYRVGTDSDYATIKYDTNGNQLWAARYDGLGNYHDDANAIVLDVQGNIYVTGWSYGIGTDSDYATVKYDTNGNQLWAARYNGPGNDSDSAYAIALDVQGNVYVTGYSSGIGTDDDYAMIKYDTNGNQLWTARYNGPGNSDDRAYAIALDASGNIYVTGQSDGINTGFDYATIKYSQSGGVITGKVTIQNRTDHSELITFELRNPGEATALETYQVLTSSDGSYTLITVPAGTYDLTAKSSNTLRAKNENIIVVDDETTIDIDFALLGGDANDDNSVGLSDRFILMKSWNTNIGDVDWDERADFNNDNSIGLSDRFIFRSNWNTSGVE